MIAPRRPEVHVPPTRPKAPTTKVQCDVCGRKVAEKGRADHAEAVHYPKLLRGRVPVEVVRPPDQPKGLAAAARKKASRREPPQV